MSKIQFFFHIQFCYIFSALCCLLQGHRDLVNVKPWVFDVGQWSSIDLLWAFPFRSSHSLLCLTSKLDSIKIHTAEIYQQPLNDEFNLAQSSMCLLLFYDSVTLGKVKIHLIQTICKDQVGMFVCLFHYWHFRHLFGPKTLVSKKY